jgi:hypothetical protein
MKIVAIKNYQDLNNGCGWNFCNVCLEYASINDIHSHVKDCIQLNNLNAVDSYFLSTNEGLKWRYQQRCRRIRKFFEKQPEMINRSGIIIELAKDKDLRQYLLQEFPEHNIDLK